MIRLPENRGLLLNTVLALILLVGQTAALGHAYQHDIGSPQNQTCTACVTAGQLSAACVDQLTDPEIQAFTSPFHDRVIEDSISAEPVLVRQRGPPLSSFS